MKVKRNSTVKQIDGWYYGIKHNNAPIQYVGIIKNAKLFNIDATNNDIGSGSSLTSFQYSNSATETEIAEANVGLIINAEKQAIDLSNLPTIEFSIN